MPASSTVSDSRLIIRPGAIGDCILSLPALEHLVTGHTEIWAPSTVVPLIRFATAVRPISSTGLDMVGIGDLPMPASLRSKLETFDSIVSWYGSNRSEFRAAMLATGVPCTFYPALPPLNYPGHAVDFFAEQVGAPLGLIPRINIPSCPSRGTIVIHPFSGSRRKNWPLERFRDLAARLPYPVEWIAGPDEELDETVRFDNLADLAAWLQGARLYIGNDSGITHLAAAVGVKTIALFGPTAPHTWAPRGSNVKILYANPLEELSVAEVFAHC